LSDTFRSSTTMTKLYKILRSCGDQMIIINYSILVIFFIMQRFWIPESIPMRIIWKEKNSKLRNPIASYYRCNKQKLRDSKSN